MLWAAYHLSRLSGVVELRCRANASKPMTRSRIIVWVGPCSSALQSVLSVSFLTFTALPKLRSCQCRTLGFVRVGHEATCRCIRGAQRTRHYNHGQGIAPRAHDSRTKRGHNHRADLAHLSLRFHRRGRRFCTQPGSRGVIRLQFHCATVVVCLAGTFWVRRGRKQIQDEVDTAQLYGYSLV